MAESISLEDLVLGYCQELDGLVEPPAYGAFEVLLPDDAAARWGVKSLQHLAFSPEIENALYIHFGHTLVDSIVEELRQKTANARFFVNNVRPEKPGLYEVIEKAFSLPNAKMFPVPGSAQKIQMHHYVQLNFKVSLIADEKRELILPMWMDLQGGYAIKGAEIERLAILEPENGFQNIPSASLLWSSAAPFSPNALTALLERARRSATRELGDTLTALQKRLQRFLELDRARLGDYYDHLRKDAERRLQKAEHDRRPALEDKLSAIAAERLSKLADVEQKYHLHTQLELINLAVISQPKLDLMVEIGKRGVAVKRRATWDPLLHVVEGLVCDVCERPGQTLFLCENGHLAHMDCLAPQCVECKRMFCQKCADEVKSCAVCDRPVCIHSLQRCSDCGRSTCHEHAGECHADAGQPRRVLVEQPVSQEPAPTLQATGSVRSSTGVKGKPPGPKQPAKKQASKARLSAGFGSLTKARPEVTGDYMDVQAIPAENLIVAWVLVKKREIATRQWTMTDQGIGVDCWCEKNNCPERGIVYRPAGAEQIKEQMMSFIEEFAEEYDVPLKKIHYFHFRLGKQFPESSLKVPASWKEPATLERAWEGFDGLRMKNRK
jgi:hypothetical protein